MARKHPKTDKEIFYTSKLGVVYAFKMASGKVKVGRTKDYEKRRRTHQITIGTASEFVDEYVSEPHLNYKENETLTLQKFSKPGREIFEGDFDTVVEFIKSLKFDTREVDEIHAYIKEEKQKAMDREDSINEFYDSFLGWPFTPRTRTIFEEGGKHQKEIDELYQEDIDQSNYGLGFIDGLGEVLCLLEHVTEIEGIIKILQNTRKGIARKMNEQREYRLEAIRNLEEIQNLSAERADLLFSLKKVRTEEEFAIYDLME